MAVEASASKVEDSSPSERYESYLLVYNIAKRQNIGNIVRSACAFGVSEVVVVGDGKLSGFGAMGTMKHMTFSKHNSLREAVKYLKEDKRARICGIEILPQAKSVADHPFSGNTAFMLGNEGTGLSEKQKSVCDDFVYIPHYGNGTASLNVTVAGSIILHHFGLWAAYPERARDDSAEAKYLVEVTDRSTAERTAKELELRAQRKANAEAPSNPDVGSMFGEPDSDSSG